MAAADLCQSREKRIRRRRAARNRSKNIQQRHDLTSVGVLPPVRPCRAGTIAPLGAMGGSGKR